MLRPAVFLDRDGTLMEDSGYIGDPEKVRILPGVREALERLHNAGFVLVIITNQSGIGRGRFTEADFTAVQERLFRDLGSPLITATYMCPDHADMPSDRRKPSPAMILEAVTDLGLDISKSWMIGDKPIDVECGRRAGARSILVLSGEGTPADGKDATFVANTLADAAEFILKESSVIHSAS